MGILDTITETLGLTAGSGAQSQTGGAASITISAGDDQNANVRVYNEVVDSGALEVAKIGIIAANDNFNNALLRSAQVSAQASKDSRSSTINAANVAGDIIGAAVDGARKLGSSGAVTVIESGKTSERILGRAGSQATNQVNTASIASADIIENTTKAVRTGFAVAAQVVDGASAVVADTAKRAAQVFQSAALTQIDANQSAERTVGRAGNQAFAIVNTASEVVDQANQSASKLGSRALLTVDRATESAIDISANATKRAAQAIQSSAATQISANETAERTVGRAGNQSVAIISEVAKASENVLGRTIQESRKITNDTSLRSAQTIDTATRAAVGIVDTATGVLADVLSIVSGDQAKVASLNADVEVVRAQEVSRQVGSITDLSRQVSADNRAGLDGVLKLAGDVNANIGKSLEFTDSLTKRNNEALTDVVSGVERLADSAREVAGTKSSENQPLIYGALAATSLLLVAKAVA